MRFNKLLLVLIFMITTASLCQDSLKLEWAKMYDVPHSYEEEPVDMVIDPQGNIFVVGITGDLETIVVKYTPNGDEAWALYYRGNDSYETIHVGIDIDGLGNIYIAGH
ncbi:MAG: hypothetical protein KKD86_17385, partial [Bacteroidetes bacterium]|nr:hypothetical protein [Bacteroidota bacterium]